MSTQDLLTLFLGGDVMIGRGIDQALPHPSDPRIYEPYLKSALGYLELAEARHGPLPRPVQFPYVWGDVLAEFERVRPDCRVINLETAVTTSDDYWPGKAIHYRMHPANLPCLTAAKIDCCVLANNHVLDWGYAGLAETLETLRGAGIATAGAGRNADEAAAPAVIEVARGSRVAVFAFGSESSGIPPEWRAAPERPGVNPLPPSPGDSVRAIARRLEDVKRAGAIVVASIHWGANWGYGVPRWQRAYAHALIDQAGVDVVHGHSSHHPRAIEVHRGRLILYGCGDLLNDYEGIAGHEEFRSELTLMYFPRLDPRTGQLVRLDMIPGRVRRFRIGRAIDDEARWLGDMLNREGKRWGTRVRLSADGTLVLEWDRQERPTPRTSTAP
jgi:poly-gamma-glutamate synthesis protein (capsule biosynthesis protein)